MLRQAARWSATLLMMAMLLTILHVPAAASLTEPLIRIGVFPQVTVGTVGAPDRFVLTEKSTGTLLYTGQGGDSVSVRMGAAAISRTHYRLQVAFSTDQAKVDAWAARASALGYVVYLEPYLNGWRIFLGEFPEDASWSVRAAFRNQAIADGVAYPDSFWKKVTIVEGKASMELDLPSGTVSVEGPIAVEADGGLVTLNGSLYRGTGEVRFNSNGSLAVVNELPLEQYLYGVVPRELPPDPYGLLEAQKAQAVAARTYALANMGKRSRDGYDLLPTTSDQVYGGYEAEHPVSNQAVDETRGMVLTYNGGLIEAVFHSTSGGYTASNEEVWNSNPVPYLRGIPDAQRGQAFEHVPTLEVFKRHAHPTSLRNAAEGDFESDWSKYHRWVVDWTQAELQAILGAWFNTETGRILALNVTERSGSGRVQTLEIVAENGTFYAYKDQVRSVMKYVNASGTYSPLRSTMVFFEPQVDPQTREITGFTGYGGGWGHGVGLSQTGAVGMAEKKATYDTILRHYYQGAELEQRY